jgi:formyltetrahydrofolate deformylase
MKARVIHGDMLQDLQRRDDDMERAVLASAVAWHAEDRVVGEGNDTIIFP